MMKKKRSSRSESGQSLTELGLIMVVVLLLLGGVVDIGRLFLTMITLNDAVDEGAVVAATCNASIVASDCQKSMEGVVKATSGPIDLHTADLTVTASYSSSGSGHPCGGDTVTVTAHYTFDMTMPLANLFVGSMHIPINAKSIATVIKPYSC
jgi:Flp pilus assembly protein TadG